MEINIQTHHVAGVLEISEHTLVGMMGLLASPKRKEISFCLISMSLPGNWVSLFGIPTVALLLCINSMNPLLLLG